MSRRLSLSVVAVVALASCGGGGGFEGRWESTFGGITLDLKGDHTVAITVVGIPSEGTWEAQGKNQIVVHGPRQDMTLTWTKEGDLSDGLGGRFVRSK